MTITLILAALAIAVIVGAVFYLKRGDSGAVDDSTVAKSDDSENSEVDGLLALNLALRKSQSPAIAVTKTEAVIDALLELIPKVEGDDSPSGELAWTVRRIASSYLPEKCVGPFLSLDASVRVEDSVLEAFIESLSALQSELDSVAEVLSRRDLSEFNKKAQFLKQRFDS